MSLREEYRGQMWNFVFGGTVVGLYLGVLWFLMMLPDSRICR